MTLQSRTLLRCAGTVLACWGASAGSVGARAAGGRQGLEQSVEQEVRSNVLGQRVGLGTLEDYALPAGFVDRIVDRIIRTSYQHRNHVIVRDAAATAPDAGNQPADRAPRSDVDAIHIQEYRPDASVARCRGALREVRPALRGYRAPILGDAATCRPTDDAGIAEQETLRRASEIVAKRIARDGLLPTAAQVIEVLGPPGFTRDGGTSPARLQSVGLPVDLLRYFEIDGDHAVVAWIARRLAEGESAKRVSVATRRATFKWVPTVQGFRVLSESGEHAVRGVRLQLTRGTLWGGEGAGGDLDVARQLLAEFPDAWFAAAIEKKHLPSFLDTARRWPLGPASRITLIPTPMVVSQWAQDNGKVGFAGAGSGDDRVVTLVPRYASRREDGSMFIPNESFLMDGFAAAGHEVAQSPLLFQGGNLFAVRHPVPGDRLLLIGEAEVYRNVALGLSEAQTIEAFRVEFGVARVIVLPAVSFHIDFELNVRAVAHRLVAFVNDVPSAVRIILECGVGAMERSGIIDAAAGRELRQHLREGRNIEFINAVASRLNARSEVRGQYPLSLAEAFSTGPIDSGVGSFQRFLLAIDLLASWSLDDAHLPADRHAAAYVRAFHRRDADRARLHKTLSDLGFKVVGVPSLSEGEHGINYVNGIQARGRYLMPAYGGLYAPLDQAAEEVYHRELGDDVRIVPVLSAETQQRTGAVHCAASVYPR